MRRTIFIVLALASCGVSTANSDRTDSRRLHQDGGEDDDPILDPIENPGDPADAASRADAAPDVQGPPEPGPVGCGDSCSCAKDQTCRFTCTTPNCTLTCEPGSTCSLFCGADRSCTVLCKQPDLKHCECVPQVGTKLCTARVQ
jgi:hypothetical protein